MKKTILYSLVTIVISFSATTNYAQESDYKGFKETIAYLNKAFDGSCKFTYKKYLKVEYFENGALHHIDQLDIRDLDTNLISVNYEKKIIRIGCHSDFGDCIKRTLLHEGNTKRFYDKSIFECSKLDDKKFKGVQNALLHLIKLAIILDYASNKPFEE